MPSKFLALSPTFFIVNVRPGAKSKYLVILFGNDIRKSPPTPIMPVNKLSAALGVNAAFALLIKPISVFLPNNFFATMFDASPNKFGCIGKASCLPSCIALTTSSVTPYLNANMSSTPDKLPFCITDSKTVFIKFLSSILTNNLNNSGGA